MQRIARTISIILTGWMLAGMSVAWAVSTDLSGRLFTSPGNLTPVPNRNVSISVSGTYVAEVITDADGTFFFPGVSLVSGDVVLVSSRDQAGMINANTVFVDWTASGEAVAGVYLYENTLSVQSRGTGSLTEEDLRIADASPDASLFSVADDVVVEAGVTLYIPHDVQFLMAGAVRLEPRGDFRIDGAFQAGGTGVAAGGSIHVNSGGVFDAGLSPLSVGGDLVATGVLQSPGAVTFVGSALSLFDPGANWFGDVVVSKADGAGVTLTGNPLIAQNLSVVQGSLNLQESANFHSAVVEALGALRASTFGKTYIFGSSVFESGAKSLTINGGSVHFTGPGSRLFFHPGSTVDVNFGSTFEMTGGAPGEEIFVGSADSTLEQWVIDVDSTADFSFRSVALMNSLATGTAAPLTAFDSVDGGNNTGWLFSASPTSVADAGADQSIHAGTSAQLDGSGSYSLEGHSLNYQWTLTSAPAGSAAALSGADTVQPAITPDQPGEYVIELVVSDALTLVSSLPDVMVLTATNEAPIANAGGDQTTPRYIVVTLDASGSSDPDGDALSYSWSLVSPAGSAAALSDPAAMNPSFQVDIAGDYVATLTVHDRWTSSAADSVTVSTYNAAPIADAGDDQVITVVGSAVMLDGSTSYDEDGDELDYAWSIESKPIGSSAALSDAFSAAPSFIADVNGKYVFQLTVVDEFGAESDPDSVTVSFENVAPVARITASSVTLVAGESVLFDGSGSYDANGDLLSYKWSMTSAPFGSQASLSGTDAASTVLDTDIVGEYVVSLVVSDGIAASEPSTVMVVTVDALGLAFEGLIALSDFINDGEDEDGLACSMLMNCSMKRTLTNKLGVVAKHLQAGEIQNAINKLTVDFQPKMDGCAMEGAPDKNDWIRSCAGGQDSAYPLLMNVIYALSTLIQ